MSIWVTGVQDLADSRTCEATAVEVEQSVAWLPLTDPAVWFGSGSRGCEAPVHRDLSGGIRITRTLTC
jgi:hypothetical protein